MYEFEILKTCFIWHAMTCLDQAMWQKFIFYGVCESLLFFLQVSLDEDTGQTVISGMGELHLDIYVERMKREYKVEVDVGQPRVNYREAITKRAEFDYLHKKQSGKSNITAPTISILCSVAIRAIWNLALMICVPAHCDLLQMPITIMLITVTLSIIYRSEVDQSVLTAKITSHST